MTSLKPVSPVDHDDRAPPPGKRCRQDTEGDDAGNEDDEEKNIQEDEELFGASGDDKTAGHLIPEELLGDREDG